MDITTRISSKPAPKAAHHHECTKDHQPILVRFTSCSPEGGFAQATALDCMFYEMEDAAHDSIVDAFESSGEMNFHQADYDSAREAATDLAERADGLLTGGKAHVRNKVAAA